MAYLLSSLNIKLFLPFGSTQLCAWAVFQCVPWTQTDIPCNGKSESHCDPLLLHIYAFLIFNCLTNEKRHQFAFPLKFWSSCQQTLTFDTHCKYFCHNAIKIYTRLLLKSLNIYTLKRHITTMHLRLYRISLNNSQLFIHWDKRERAAFGTL